MRCLRFSTIDGCFGHLSCPRPLRRCPAHDSLLACAMPYISTSVRPLALLHRFASRSTRAVQTEEAARGGKAQAYVLLGARFRKRLADELLLCIFTNIFIFIFISIKHSDTCRVLLRNHTNDIDVARQ